ncbi:hypothetical protein ACIPYS_12290 [Kitasatospora sp. NPDC089913]|uniref:hypothetical protein n=1 Tax=Kitasatospora sp. NPDC089913 TaxID=3364080 RepID=UPI00382713E4
MDDGTTRTPGGYWDPLPTARRLLAERPHLDQFGGLWADRNWRNVPGPFYGADTDSMQTGRQDAPFHIAYDDEFGPLDGREFVYRQPTDAAQTHDLLNGCFAGHGGFAMDGDEYWTDASVREWWHERGRVREWAVTTSARWSRVRGEHRAHYRDAAQGLRDYLAHLDGGLNKYLRNYLFHLAEGRSPLPGEALPELLRPRRPATPHTTEPLLAGYFVGVPGPLSGSGIPRTELLTTASNCLIDWLPQDDCWFATPTEALTACATVAVPAEARLFALLVPGDHVHAFVTDIREAETDEPVLLAHLDGPDPTPEPAEGGRTLGWEVLGYDWGILHTWLCNDLHDDAVRRLGITTNDRGMLPDRATAERVATWANARDDTKPVTWFPATLLEWDTPIESTFVPVLTDPAPPRPTPWWQRLADLF